MNVQYPISRYPWNSLGSISYFSTNQRVLRN
jgi:hypothetical protein